MTLSNKKVIKVAKKKEEEKNTFSFKADDVHFCVKGKFLTAPEPSCCRCGKFDIGVTICVWWLSTLLNKSGKGFKIFLQCYYFPQPTSFKQIGSSIGNTRNKNIILSAKKCLQGKANCSPLKTVIGVTKVGYERYLPYLQLC